MDDRREDLHNIHRFDKECLPWDRQLLDLLSSQLHAVHDTDAIGFYLIPAEIDDDVVQASDVPDIDMLQPLTDSIERLTCFCCLQAMVSFEVLCRDGK